MRENPDVWKTVMSLNGLYEVNSDGRIRNARTKRELKTHTNKFGYRVVQTRPQKNQSKNCQIHGLVAEAFLGQRPRGYVVNHKDGNKQNNSPENLEYVTPTENNIHALKTGLRKPAKMQGKVPCGEQHPKAIITEETVRDIWRLREETGYGPRRIAKMLGLKRTTVDPIIYGKNWNCLKNERSTKNDVRCD